MTSTCTVDRAKVWQHLTEAHPALAERLQAPDVREWGSVTLQGLPDPTRRYVWEAMKRRHPQTATFIATDPVFAALRATFGATFTFSVDMVVEAIGHEIGAVVYDDPAPGVAHESTTDVTLDVP
jgi:hypothetical protein